MIPIYFVDMGDFRVKIPKNNSKEFEGYINKYVILGLRAENIYHPNFMAVGIEPCVIECKVEVIEPMGNEIYLYLVAGQHNIIARADLRSSCKTDAMIGICFDIAKMHLFDPDKNPDNPTAI